MSQGDLGGATFTVSADTTGFDSGMRRAKEAATAAQQAITTQTKHLEAKATANVEATRRSVERLTSMLDRGRAAGGGRMGYGLYAIGNAIDDLQYGFRSVVNNIPQVVMLMGGGAGFAGAAAVAAVAVNQLVQHWDQLGDMMRSSWLNVPAEQLERLRIRAEEAGAAFDELMKKPSKREAVQVRAIAEAFVEPRGGPGGGLKGVREALTAEPEAFRGGLGAALGVQGVLTDDEKDQVRKMQDSIAAIGKNMPNLKPAEQERARRIIAETREAIAKMTTDKLAELAKQLIGQALLPGEKGAGARGNLRELMRRHPDNFMPEFRRRMEAATIDLDANRAAAHAMMGAPAGTALMLERERKARTGADVLRDSRLFRRLNPAARARFGGMMQGLRADQVESVLAGMTPAAIEKFRANLPDPATRKAVAGHELANMVPGLIKAAREMPAPAEKPTALEDRVGAQLKAAGLDADPKGTVREMRKLMEERVKAIMLERGVSKDQARLIMLQEQERKAFGNRPPAQFIGHADLAKRIQLGAFQHTQDIGRRSLAELIAIRKAIADANKPKPPAAAPTAAPAPAVAVGPR